MALLLTQPPEVSIVLVSYQHAKYARDSIASVLAQTASDFEIIIVDDGSTDGTREVVSGFDDPRIRLLFQENKGPSLALNAGLQQARGQFVGLMSADDMAAPSWIASQLQTIRDSMAEVSFCLPSLIDDESASLPDEKMGVFFTHEIRDSNSALRHFFWYGNALLAPGVFLARGVFERIGQFAPALYQLQDFEYWIRCAKQTSIAFNSKRLIFYRLRDTGLNLSSVNNLSRMGYEFNSIYGKFFEGMQIDQFLNAFAPECELWFSPRDTEEIEQISWLLYLQHQSPSVRRCGWSRLLRVAQEGRSEYLTLGNYRVPAVAIARSALGSY